MRGSLPLLGVLSAPLVTNNAKDYRHLGNLQLVSAAG